MQKIDLVPVPEEEIVKASEFHKRLLTSAAISIQATGRGYITRRYKKDAAHLRRKAHIDIPEVEYNIYKNDFDQFDTNGNGVRSLCLSVCLMMPVIVCLSLCLFHCVWVLLPLTLCLTAGHCVALIKPLTVPLSLCVCVRIVGQGRVERHAQASVRVRTNRHPSELTICVDGFQ